MATELFVQGIQCNTSLNNNETLVRVYLVEPQNASAKATLTQVLETHF